MLTHRTVLLREAAEALVNKPDGRFVDCTYGRGGHAAAILERLNDAGRLMVIDRDAQAISDATEKFGDDKRVIIVHGAFSDIEKFVDEHNLRPVDGVLMDLGVSSPQLDEAARGFSFDRDGPLDMRMDTGSGESASAWLMHAEEKDIAYVLKHYGEERFARRIARGIVEARVEAPIERTHQLVSIIDAAMPRKERHKHPATRSFQAIRIFINRELEELETGLNVALDILASGGRLVVISFHSLEDRIVKRFMRDQARGERLPDKLPIRDAEIKRSMRLAGKPVKASEEEIQANRRARSSIMRVAEKI